MRMITHPPVGMESRTQEFGICDECGCYSDTLGYKDGEWLCTNCEKFG